MRPRTLLLALPPTVVAVLACIYLLDAPIARFVAWLLSRDVRLEHGAGDIPGLLEPFVVLLTSACFLVYAYLRWRGAPTHVLRLFLLVGTAAPVAFVTKSWLKTLFGRVKTRVWLEDPWLYDFHWFHGGGDFAGFPSGHMAVFAALATVFWNHEPRLRRAVVVVLLLLGGALVFTNHHFLGDVVAGAYLGAAVGLVVERGWAVLSGPVRR